MSITVSAFYKFVPVADCAVLREGIEAECLSHGIKGTILVAPEGINGTVSGTEAGMAGLLAWLRADPRFADLVTKQSRSDDHPFAKLKIKIKPEIVTFGVPEADPHRAVGTYVKPSEWNALISDPGVVVIDTRNSYEFSVGTFERALDPGTRSFTEFPDFVRSSLDPANTPRVAMFCTGGIRCEKATSYMLSLGFREVYHLEGGILNYLETVPESESLWRGGCFVFDDRVAVGHGVGVIRHTRCATCGQPIRTEDGPAHSAATPRCPACRAAA